MRVWIINHYAIPPSMGGLVRHYYFSKFLRERGHQVRIFTASEIHNTDINMIRDGALYREETMDGVPYTFLKTRDYSGNGLSRIINMLEFPLRIQQSVNHFARAGERPDVIYTSAPTIFAAASAAICAANGVDLREPLKPTVPADCQEITLPWGSVMETMVLLNVDLM